MTEGRTVAVTGEVSGAEVLRCVGRQIRLLRTRARLERPELGRSVGYSPATVAALEQGRRVPQPEFLTAADSVLKAGGVLGAAVDLMAHVRLGGAGRVVPETVAAWHGYATMTVPEPLRTAGYARAVLRMARPLLPEETIEERLAAHAARPPVPLLSCVLEESVLHRPYGGWEVLRGQLAHLWEVGQRRQVEVQVMPTALEDHAGTEGPFALLEPEDGRTAVVRADGRLVTGSAAVRALEQRYTALRAQALSPADSLALVGELAKRA
ncbi:helix-turn-helix transcriptional regulator [Streptomyces sp. DH37]|uniref:helix-turn-helix domain-containing protein n=1 Tax=Streptomyces sp. DH37 TaxID=3040122 RepID=UPI0024429A2D|nr:helix-turn-helix transcriptional regulator [Streptomyces sp. DH37]MDG9701897.1 helix-turn-helix transcriptional regulator [Streptomyces sp. DH37]